MIALLFGISHSGGFRRASGNLHDLVITGPLNQQSRRRITRLPGVEHALGYGLCNPLLQITVSKNQIGRLAAQLQSDALYRICRVMGD